MPSACTRPFHRWAVCTFADANTACAPAFKVDTTRRSYSDSVKYCQSQNMVVASIHNQQENDKVKAMLKAKTNAYYLGATETSTNAKFVWDDGSPWDYTNPSNDGLRSSESRIAFTIGTPQWHDWGNNQSKLGVVCRNICGKSAKFHLCAYPLCFAMSLVYD